MTIVWTLAIVCNGEEGECGDVLNTVCTAWVPASAAMKARALAEAKSAGWVRCERPRRDLCPDCKREEDEAALERRQLFPKAGAR